MAASRPDGILQKIAADENVRGDMERVTRLELATSTLARWRSTR